MPAFGLPENTGIFWVSLAAGLLGLILGKLYRQIANAVRTSQMLADMPKAPGQAFIVGQALTLLKGCPWELMHKWVVKSPPVVHVQIMNMAFVIVGSAEGVKRVFQTGQRQYIKDLEMSYKPFMGILGKGLVTAEGSHWQHQRVKLGPVLRYDMLENVAEIAHVATLRLCKKLDAAKASGEAIEMEEEFRILTLQIIGEAFLSLTPEESDRVFPNLYLPLMTEGNVRSLRPWRMYIPTPSWFKYRRGLGQLDAYVIGILRARWTDRQHGRERKNDLLEKRLEIITDAAQPWDKAMQVQLCYEFKTFLLAGHETSAAMLTWTLFELSRSPDKLARVRQEAETFFVGAQDLRAGAEKMEYTLCCLKETLRRYSVVPVVTRQAAVDEEICGYRVPKGAHVACLISAVHETEWEDPQEWRPERFLPGGEYESFDDSIRQHKFVPFISGPRNCLGQYFALLEARVVLATIVQDFSFKAINKNPVPSQVVIPLGPTGGMHMLVH